VLQLSHTYANTVRRTRSRFNLSSLYHLSSTTALHLAIRAYHLLHFFGMNIDQPQCRSKRDRPLSRLAVCIDFGGSNIRASVATIDGTKAPVFRLIKKWPGRSVPKSASGEKRKRGIKRAHDRADNSKETRDFFSYYVSGDH
jgi:hypothetical protein